MDIGAFPVEHIADFEKGMGMGGIALMPGLGPPIMDIKGGSLTLQTGQMPV
ncbi:hypothetical protein D3C81_2118110 [compost metagenome]